MAIPPVYRQFFNDLPACFRGKLSFKMTQGSKNYTADVLCIPRGTNIDYTKGET
jgi:hypothetical protein